MKRVVIIIISCLLTISIVAQEHLKFMGIPLNGTISVFQEKLKSKGVQYNSKVSSKTPKGMRCFTGVFSGEKADIYVYYNDKTKIVYRAKAVIECISKEHGEQKFNKFYSMLKEKYLTGVIKDGEQEGHPAMLINVLDNNFDQSYGYVSMYMSNSTYSFMDEVYLHIDYEDRKNTISDMDKNMDDL